MDDVGIVAALHGGADDVFQVAVDNQVNVDASGLGEGVGDLRPDIGAVSGLDGGNLDGGGFRRVSGVGGIGGISGVGGVAGVGGGVAGIVGAASKHGDNQHQSEEQRKDFFEFHFSTS